MNKLLIIVMLAILLLLNGCKTFLNDFGVDMEYTEHLKTKERAETENYDFNDLKATKNDMKLLVNNICSLPFSKYMFMITSDIGWSITGVFDIESNKINLNNIGAFTVLNNGIYVNVNMQGAEDGNTIGFCGGTFRTGIYTVKIVPGVYIPTEYSPISGLPEGVLAEIDKDKSIKILFPSSWADEKKLVAYMHIKNGTFTYYGRFSTIPELKQLLEQALNESKRKGEDLHIMREKQTNLFVLVGYKTKNIIRSK